MQLAPGLMVLRNFYLIFMCIMNLNCNIFYPGFKIRYVNWF